MAEATFARAFLSSLDSRPVKLSADHVEDPRKYPAQPAYILPRMPNPMSKPVKLAPGQERSITVMLKSLRNPPLDIKLTSQPVNTSLLDIKSKVSSQARIPVEKIKIIHNKRPVADSKILKDVMAENDRTVDFSIMIVGGAAAIAPDNSVQAPSEATGNAVVQSPEFWTDLKGFLMQRLKDQATAEELCRLFKASWESHKSRP
ncbi:hypothetical protein CDD81_3307 [Ophiocordyceps australis]|uniref:Ubiquitin-like domain-containing protein n=1 Tax=Ophiocordyceps australis TaxID=1399860 RepID=A0A2C5YBT8_9HYPO|nr:hypothetical protein CDD81_3307 [Ophiocordyceps australis]